MRTLRTSEIFNDSRFTLIAVESVEYRHSKTNTVCELHGNIEPIAVVVHGPDGTYALDMESKPADFDQLRQDIPGLDAIVAPDIVRNYT